jgi:hypothetical protein
MQQFTSETSARQWERRMLAKGYEQDTSGKGWKYGYPAFLTASDFERFFSGKRRLKLHDFFRALFISAGQFKIAGNSSGSQYIRA